MKVLWVAVVACFSSLLMGQTGSLRGTVTDESGAVVPNAVVVLGGVRGRGARRVRSNGEGAYSVSGLTPGDYTVQAAAPGLATAQPVKVTLTGADLTLDLQLKVALTKQELTVGDTADAALAVDAAANANATVLRGADLDALSDNTDDLMVDLQALAGPSAGPNGNAVFVDGFSGGELPPKNTIREVRINQNPFAPEYDRLGLGRIEIFTKPGSDKFHADLGYNFASDKLNSRNPYAAGKAPFHLHEFREQLGGPLSKKSSFSLAFTREWVDNGNAVNGVTLDPLTLAVTPFTGTPVSTLRRTNVTPRVDYQLSTNHTLSVRYLFNRDAVNDAGVGSFNLLARGFHNDARSQTLQVTETAVINSSTINETRFQYFRPTTIATANNGGVALQVLGSFHGGGNPIGRSVTTQNNYEFQNYTSILRARHSWKFGARLRGVSEVNEAPQNFGGTFTFSGVVAPQLDGNNRMVIGPGGEPLLVNITSIESYRRTVVFQQQGLAAAQIRALGGGASQFSINAGDPRISGSQFDAGLFAGDDWKARPNLTLSLGARYELQTNVSDWSNAAVRIGAAWAPGTTAARSRARSVIRAGFGLFYDRFGLGNTLTALRYNGVRQRQYLIANPDFFPNVPAADSFAGQAQGSAIQQVSGGLRIPYLMQSALGYERQLPRSTTVAVTYANTHGLHMLRSQNINAPLPGTYNPLLPGSGVYPFGRAGLVANMESSGLYNQNQVIFTVNTKASKNVSLNGSYAYNRALSNTDGLGTFPGRPYTMVGEYSPAATDIRHRASLAGTITTFWGLRWNPLLTANSGPPFDINSGRDYWGTTLFNARPGIATDASKPGVVRTSYGLLDPNPVPGQALLGRNFGRGPGQVMSNMRVGRTFTFGSARENGAVSTGGAPASAGGGGGGAATATAASPFSLGGGQGGGPTSRRRYSLTVSMQVRNLLNHNNPGAIIGNITSPLFGQANQPAGSGNAIFAENANNRRLELQMRFAF